MSQVILRYFLFVTWVLWNPRIAVMMNEPLAAKRSRSSFRSAQPEQPVSAYRQSSSLPLWRKCLPNYSTTFEQTDDILALQNRVKQELQGLTPVAIFEKLFDDEVFTMIAEFSILYANQNNRHNFIVTATELKTFMGILILSGYHKLPREHMYWSLDEDIGVAAVSKSMSRNRFREIKRNLHLVDNNDAPSTLDKMFKVRKLSDILMKKFNQWGVFHETLSVDESMIKYFGHHPAKQFIPGKHLIDMTMSNAWRLHVIAKEEPMDQLLFRRSVARHYLKLSPQRCSDRPSSSNIESLQLDGVDHVPEKLPKRVRCAVCHIRGCWGCKKCKKTLCIRKIVFRKFSLIRSRCANLGTPLKIHENYYICFFL